jgi:predicted  nucleic acid-binding Zn-ribbon protein
VAVGFIGEGNQGTRRKPPAIRISTDGTTTKLKAENDRLRKERNIAKYHVARITKEKEELEHELQHEIDAAKVKHDTLKKEKNELTSTFQQKAKRYQEKIHQLEKDHETLVAR